ncbi:MAG: hypothetical protein UV68_C0052G0005 [Candidatus Collierbacteria bacterium GW2011_GWC2_43_12]|uniref:Uncharacterized protein n=1 Tax=Candidatus Collierbacteria bacterium GW2011_GWC2_43_12 TaxID=1618390 RepID=A0A0G1FAF8_9BACT|nr:MAG: hypothetical protein UV68_C0052G0005 [Candidatus Collierbacteria bacterium GW2011_GWC2_43_12]
MDEITPEQAKTFAQDNKTIYDEKGRVADVGVAHEVAALEAPGHDIPSTKVVADVAASAMESVRQQEAVLQGMSEDEKNNMKILEGLTRKPENGEPANTHAFIDKVDSKGRSYRVLRNSDKRQDTGNMEPDEREFFGWVYFFTKDGPFMVNIRNFGSAVKDTNEIIDIIDWGKLGDIIEDASQFPKERVNINLDLPINYYGREDKVSSGVSRYDVRLDTAKLARAIQYAEKIGVEQENKKLRKVVDPDEVLRGLVG